MAEPSSRVERFGARFSVDADGVERVVPACNARGSTQTAHPGTMTFVCFYDQGHAGNHSWQDPPPALGQLFEPVE